MNSPQGALPNIHDFTTLIMMRLSPEKGVKVKK
jgi:hypothetical protein